jgi:hypothetical protein
MNEEGKKKPELLDKLVQVDRSLLHDIRLFNNCSGHLAS